MICHYFHFFFFFSSRRRHTRLQGDWSSDVCSSDLLSDQDPPSRVGRLSFLSGSVSLRPGSVDDWATATVNYPLTTGDHLWTDADARAEITIGSSAIRLASQSAFGFLALDDRTTQVRLSQGTLAVRLRHLGDDESFEIDTPNGAVSLLRPGSYRVDVDSSGDTTTVTVRHGEAEVTANGSAFSVHADDAAVVIGTDAPSYDIHAALRPDAWEDWCVARDRRWDEARSARYVSREVIGHEDLDDYGDWRETGPYGAVWVPRSMIVGWAPYRYGHWAWVDPWGWTWIDDAPWGFAPFHYGRWVYVDDGWAWVPGHVVARPVYAPALVVFVGGRNWSVAIGLGGGGGSTKRRWSAAAPGSRPVGRASWDSPPSSPSGALPRPSRGAQSWSARHRRRRSYRSRRASRRCGRTPAGRSTTRRSHGCAPARPRSARPPWCDLPSQQPAPAPHQRCAQRARGSRRRARCRRAPPRPGPRSVLRRHATRSDPLLPPPRSDPYGLTDLRQRPHPASGPRLRPHPLSARGELSGPHPLSGLHPGALPASARAERSAPLPARHPRGNPAHRSGLLRRSSPLQRRLPLAPSRSGLSLNAGLRRSGNPGRIGRPSATVRKRPSRRTDPRCAPAP